jgi:hypothetical protein
MRLQKSPPPSALAELANRQHGAIAHRQLRALGYSEPAIQRLARAHLLHRLYRGVYAFGHAQLTRSGHWMAAVLACGDGAVLSHRDAAAAHGLRQNHRRDIDVTAARSRHAQAGITLHRVRTLSPGDKTVLDRVPVTTVERSLLDYAEVVSERQFNYAFDEADRRLLIDMHAMNALLARSNGRRGVKPLRARLGGVYAPIPFTRSDFERDFLELLRELGIPAPAMNVWVAGHEVDLVWWDRKLVIELDSRAYHEARAAREHDLVRNADLVLAGFRVLPISDRRFYTARPEVAATVAGAYFRKPS